MLFLRITLLLIAVVFSTTTGAAPQRLTPKSNKGAQPSLPKESCGKKVCLKLEPESALSRYREPGEPPGIGMFIGPDGIATRFFTDQVVFKPKNSWHLRRFLRTTGATVIQGPAPSVPPPPPGVSAKKRRNIQWDRNSYVLKIPNQVADLRKAAQSLDSWQKSKPGQYRINEKGLQAFQFFLKYRNLGEEVSLSLLADPPTDEPRVLSETREELVADVVQDAFDYPYAGDPAVGLTKAWQYIDLLRPLAATANPYTEEHENRVFVAIVDRGFKESPDLIRTHLQLDGNSDWGQTSCGFFDFTCDEREPSYDLNVMNEPILQMVSQNGVLVPRTPLVCPLSGCWHGFKVESVAMALPDNGVGIAGPGGQVSFPMLFRRNDDLGDERILIETAVDWGADIMNLSFGGTYSGADGASAEDINTGLQEERRAITRAVEGGVIVIASAGNDNLDLDTVDDRPCEISGVICVGAGSEERWTIPGVNGLDSNGNPACLALPTPDTPSNCIWKASNYGANVDIWVPVPVNSLNSTDCAACNMTVEELANEPVTVGPGASTSVAAPFIAGVVAMMKAIRPSLTPAEALEILQATANRSYDPTIRNGYVNVRRAIEMTMELEGVSLPPDGNDTLETGERFPDDFIGDRDSVFEGTITPGGDNDYFILPNNNQRYMAVTASLQAENVEVNGEIQGRFSQGEIRISSGTSGSTFGSDFLPPGSGINQIRLWGSPDTFNGYRLSVGIQRNINIPADRYDDQSPAGEPRNDTPSHAAFLRGATGGTESGEVTAESLEAVTGVQVRDLNFDLSEGDNDYFLLDLPEGGDCPLEEEISEMREQVRRENGEGWELRVFPGRLTIRTLPHPNGHAPGSIELKAFDGTNWRSAGIEGVPLDDNLNGDVRIECPRQRIGSGRIGISVKPGSLVPGLFEERRNFYHLSIQNHPWMAFARPTQAYFQQAIETGWLIAVTDSLGLSKSDPSKGIPLFYPTDPVIFEACRNGRCPDPIPPELILINLDQAVRDLAVGISSATSCNILLTLKDERGNKIASGEQIIGQSVGEKSKDANQKETSGFFMTNLAEGSYTLEISGNNSCEYELHMGKSEAPAAP